LGRVSQTQLNSDPNCTNGGGDKVDTTYDADGRVYSVSNPYCVAGESTSGLTTYSYDGLNRTRTVTHPDGSVVTTTYGGRATQVQDEGNGSYNVTRISQVDGLGRITGVCEVAAAPFVGPNGNSSSSLIGQNGTPSSCGLDMSGNGFPTSYAYDTLSNLTQVIQGTMPARNVQLRLTFSPDQRQQSRIWHHHVLI
jgi:YD repeat-containing protein